MRLVNYSYNATVMYTCCMVMDQKIEVTTCFVCKSITNFSPKERQDTLYVIYIKCDEYKKRGKYHGPTPTGMKQF